tara:strand:+ start:3143 stop:4012 length:870 start_codon:yes stop_codon:yes gene_type:complete
MISNPVYKDLKSNGLIKDENLSIISTETRDEKMKVFLDLKSKIIFLEEYITKRKYYQENASGKITDDFFIKNGYYEDDIRRYEQFNKFIINKKILDFGCEWGGFLSIAEEKASFSAGLELNLNCIDYMKKNLKKTSVFSEFDEINNSFDTITTFHCLEHIPNQIAILKQLYNLLNENGLLIVEVPHAKDFLIQSVDLPKFKKFTFWSEHLVLHTEASLKKFLSLAGFKEIKVQNFQRYSFTNHLGWFLDGKPGGHVKYSNLYDERLNDAYSKSRCATKTADTLIAFAKK